MPMIREKALRNESLETNNAKDCLQSCGYLSKWTSFLLFRVRILRIWGRKTEAKNDFTVWSHSAFVEFQIIHTVNDFSQSLLDILESRVMKRMSINHCVEVDADNYRKGTRKLRARVQLHRMWDKKVNHCEERSGLNHTSSPLPFPPISITIELTRKRSFPYAQKSRSRL